MLRYRGKRNLVDKVKELDAFTKVPEQYVEGTWVGGTFSVIAFVAILWLLYSEITFFIDSNLVFKFTPDTDMDDKLPINIDITVGMPCANIGADILDSTSQNTYGFGTLNEEDTWFELSPEQRDTFDAFKSLNSYLREEYHSIWKLLWKKGHGSAKAALPNRKKKLNRHHDACRLHGVLIINKVAGNFHITAGKSLQFGDGHIHLSMFFADKPKNFSHRINRFSFGTSAIGIIHPLEGDEVISYEKNMVYQYFIDIVPTDIYTSFESVKSYQYSVKELVKPEKDMAIPLIPGIYFKYDMAALKIKVYQERENLLQFILRLFATIGGIYVLIGFINALVVLVVKSQIIRSLSPTELDTENVIHCSKSDHDPYPY